MSLFGAMTTAISGLSAQSTSFSNIGDNLANTQTIGYKQVGTTFGDYITTSNLQVNESGAVVARPDYANSVQGSITQSTSPLNLAISGQGFFPVSTPTGDAGGLPTFDTQKLYTREGDFKLDRNGFLVNSTGHYLNGWVEGANGQLDQTKVVPLQVGQSGYAPVKTSNASIAANLPATPASNAPVTTELPVYDAVGTPNNIELSWTPTATPNVWSLSISQQGAATPLGSVNVAFGAAGNAAAGEGTIGSVTTTSGAATGSTYGAGQQATVGITADFGLGPQPISINLGTFGGTDGVTQFAGSSYNLVGLSQNGVQPGKLQQRFDAAERRRDRELRQWFVADFGTRAGCHLSEP